MRTQTHPPSTQQSPIIRIDSLVKRYGLGESIVYAVNGVSLEIHKSEFVCLMGSSGSGKSTLLNILGTIDVPDSGSVVVNGRQLMGMQDVELTLFEKARGVGGRTSTRREHEYAFDQGHS